MDTRIALKKNTELRFYNSDNGICIYTIQKELARGASCIVYDASYVNNSGVKKAVRVKECYPFTLTISRSKDNSLIPISSDESLFEERKKKMRIAFDLGNELFSTSGLTNFTSNTVDVYELNNTVYVVTTYQEGDTLSYHKFSSLKDCIAVVKSTAKVIEKIHHKGYLYLDIKPENIFSLTGTTDVVQLFDFDSLVPIGAMSSGTDDCEYKISYTKGFSALELKIGNQKKVGKHTDVYAIGAILFYLIFGTAPVAPDCDMDAEYDFAYSKYAKKSFQDRLYEELTYFFHNTLANYHLDRYQDMQQVIVKLEELQKLADTTIPFIQNSYVACPKILVGRENEFKKLDEWFEQKQSNILFVTGMGGIGKSSLVRGYISNHAYQFDNIIYLNYHRSLKQTIADDSQFVINAVSQSRQEEPDEYFIRKLAVAKKLTNEKRVVVVIDNFSGEELSGIEELACSNWNVIFIARNSVYATDYNYLQVEAIKDKNDIYLLFENNLRRSIDESEYPTIDRIVDRVKGHTLVLELIAKQVEHSFLTLSDSEKLITEKGVLEIAPEKVPYTKDSIASLDTLKNIIDQLFFSANVTEQKKSILKGIAYFGTGGISVHQFASIYGLETKDVINELVADGWITVENHILIMHPVIIEIVCAWKNEDIFNNAAIYMMNRLTNLLTEDKQEYIKLCEEFLDSCKGQSELEHKQLYRELLFAILCVMPRHREEYILSNALTLADNIGNLNGNAVVKLYDLISEIYEEQQDLKRAYEYIEKAKTAISKFDDDHIKGQYYYLLVGYYDKKLDGWYTTTNKEEEKTLSTLLKALDNAIKHMKKSRHQDGRKLLAEYLRCKANILIRSNPRAKIRIAHLLNMAEAIIEEEGQKYTELGCGYYLTRAWYHTYVEQDNEKVSYYIRQAYEVETKICENDLDMIDNLFVPLANILLECEQGIEATKWLLLGIRLCDDNEEIIPFVRKKMELYTYLLDIYRYTDDEKKYFETVEIVKELNKLYKY